MRATQHPSNNDVLGAPPGATIDECHALPITRILYEDGTHAIAHYWKPDGRELNALLAGESVRVIVLARTHSPMSLGVSGDGWDA